MKDHEGEVRKAYCQQPVFCQLLVKFSTKPIVLNKIVPVANELSQDPKKMFVLH